MGAGVEDGGGEGASAAGHGCRGAFVDEDPVERGEQPAERPVDLVPLVVDDETGERGIELDWQFRAERGGEFAEQALRVGAERSSFWR